MNVNNSVIYAVVTAAGSGQRLGADLPKALVPLSGSPLFMWTVREISKLKHFGGGVITAPAGFIRDFQEHLSALNPQIATKWQVVPGGQTRQASIYQGLLQLKESYLESSSLSGSLSEIRGDEAFTKGNEALVLIHDAARALTPLTVFENVIEALEAGWKVVTPVLPVADTIRMVSEDKIANKNQWELAGEDVPRSQLRIVQTPQGFRFNTIFALHKQWSCGKNLPEATDDAQMASAAGYKQVFVPGHPQALKITVAADLDLAEFLLAKRNQQTANH